MEAIMHFKKEKKFFYRPVIFVYIEKASHTQVHHIYHIPHRRFQPRTHHTYVSRNYVPHHYIW